jgi:hypothetical protein
MEYFTHAAGQYLRYLQAKYPKPAPAPAAAATGAAEEPTKKDGGKGGRGKGKARSGKANNPTQGQGSSPIVPSEQLCDVASEKHAELCAKLQAVNWEELFTAPGMPKHPTPDFSNSLSESALTLAAAISVFAGKPSKENRANVAAFDISVSTGC